MRIEDKDKRLVKYIQELLMDNNRYLSDFVLPEYSTLDEAREVIKHYVLPNSLCDVRKVKEDYDRLNNN